MPFSPESMASTDAVSPDQIVRSGLCIGCGACAGTNEAARMRMDAYGQFKPEGPSAWRRERSPQFSRLCPFSPSARNETQLAEERFSAAAGQDARIGRFEAAYVGAVAESDFRDQGSSGGLVSWVAAELLRRGLVDGVAHVAPVTPRKDGAFFGYRVSRSAAEVRQGAKSRYYPVELSGVLRQIREVPGRYALVGIPCFIKAVHLLRRQEPVLAERIVFTLGLFCGHMKSARMIESFGWQMGGAVADIERFEFRLKDPARPANWYTAQLTRKDGSTGQKAWWDMADGDWGAGFFQNSACNFCDDVAAETADIAFGDAWVEPYSSDPRGTNVVVVRSPILHGIVTEAMTAGRLDLDPVDADFVVETQAAGFRQRREGLAYRLTWWRSGVRPLKRVPPGAAGLPLRRRLIYRMRAGISAWSHRMFRLARSLHWPGLYIGWARASLSLYQGLAYSRGRVGRLLDRFLN